LTYFAVAAPVRLGRGESHDVADGVLRVAMRGEDKDEEAAA